MWRILEPGNAGYRDTLRGGDRPPLALYDGFDLADRLVDLSGGVYHHVVELAGTLHFPLGGLQPDVQVGLRLATAHLEAPYQLVYSRWHKEEGHCFAGDSPDRGGALDVDFHDDVQPTPIASLTCAFGTP